MDMSVLEWVVRTNITGRRQKNVPKRKINKDKG
jgi:hypothetical protein